MSLIQVIWKSSLISCEEEEEEEDMQSVSSHNDKLEEKLLSQRKNWKNTFFKMFFLFYLLHLHLMTFNFSVSVFFFSLFHISAADVTFKPQENHK